MAQEHAGKTLHDMLWDQAVAQYGVLMDLTEDEETWKLDDVMGVRLTLDEAKGVQTHWQLQGKLQGLAYALHIFMNPYRDDVKEHMAEIKEEIAERWEALEDDEEEDE